MANEKDNPRNEFLEHRERIEALERYVDELKREGVGNRVADLEDAKIPDLRPVGIPPNLQASEPEESITFDEACSLDVEFGVPKVDVSAEENIVTLRPTDMWGEEFDDADDVLLYVANDRAVHQIQDRGWVATAGDVIGTILSFVRFPTWNAEEGWVEGVLVGENRGIDYRKPGDIKVIAGNTIEDGYLLCDGSAVSRETYADLFDAIGTLWGAGDESTTFNLPDTGGKAMRGYLVAGGDFDTVGKTGGTTYYDLGHTHGNGSPTCPTTHGVDNYAWKVGVDSDEPEWTGLTEGYRPNLKGETDPHEIDNHAPWACFKVLIKT